MSVKIAYILKMFPRFSETFIVNEILELERQGAEIRIYSLLKPDDGRFHASLARVKANVIYVPQYPEMEPERIKLAHQRLRRAVPENYEAVRSYTEAKNAPYAIKRFLQAGFVADHLLQNPVDAVHAHFGSSAARTANLVNRLIGVPYSFTMETPQKLDPRLQVRGGLRLLRSILDNVRVHGGLGRGQR